MNFSIPGKDHFKNISNYRALMLAYKKLKYFLELEKQQWLSPKQLHELSFRRLRSLINHAYDKVPFYRKTFDQYGIKPGDITNISDLRKLPIIKKKSFQQENFMDFLAEGIDPQRCVTSKTSGSTGMPLMVRSTENESLYGNLTLARAVYANGKRPWHKSAFLKDPRRPSNKYHSRQRPNNTLYLNAGQDTCKQLETLCAFKPDVIWGYNNSLKLIACAIKRYSNRNLSPISVFGIAELLDDPTRKLINEAFGVEMIDLYASTEAQCIAWECSQHSGYHINTDTVIVEFIHNGKPAKAGEPGRVVITPLFLYSMPFIRYDLGDIATPMNGQCACGRGLPLMEMIQGRADDFITLLSGAVVPPVDTFASVIEREPDIVEYLVVQEDYDFIRVKLVSSNRNSTEKANRVKKGVERLTMHEATVQVVFVDHIDRGNEAKLRRIISNVPLNI